MAVNPWLENMQPLQPASAISGWPPAPGWWLLLALGLLALALLLYRIRQWRRANAYRRQALRELQQLRADTQDAAGLRALPLLMRRVARCASTSPPQDDLSWWLWLDQSFSDTPFQSGLGALLKQLAYASPQSLATLNCSEPSSAELARLFLCCEQWIRRHRRHSDA